LQRIMGELEVGMPIRAARPGRDRQLLEVAYFGGMRVSELVSLPWSQVIRRDTGEAQLPIVGKGDKFARAPHPGSVGEGKQAAGGGVQTCRTCR
jgi:site-specific recombinase XerC